MSQVGRVERDVGVMDHLTRLGNDICVSLWLKPATFDELKSRDFLQYRSKESVDRILMRLEKEKSVFVRSGKYHTYKRVAKKLANEYELSVARELTSE